MRTHRFIAILLLGLLAAHASAWALTTQHGSMCKPYGNSNVAGVYTYSNGLFNYSGTDRYVVCPVLRTAPAGSGGFAIWIDGTAGSGTANCTFYSYSYDGSFLGAVSFSATGTFDRQVALPQSQVTTFSSQVVVCYLPNNGGIYDVEPIQ